MRDTEEPIRRLTKIRAAALVGGADIHGTLLELDTSEGVSLRVEIGTLLLRLADLFDTAMFTDERPSWADPDVEAYIEARAQIIRPHIEAALEKLLQTRSLARSIDSAITRSLADAGIAAIEPLGDRVMVEGTTCDFPRDFIVARLTNFAEIAEHQVRQRVHPRKRKAAPRLKKKSGPGAPRKSPSLNLLGEFRAMKGSKNARYIKLAQRHKVTENAMRHRIRTAEKREAATSHSSAR